MSWKGSRGNSTNSSYKKSAGRLRDVLESRNLEAQNQIEENHEEGEGSEQKQQTRRPPGLRGREIGMWHARQNALRKNSEPKERMVS